MLGWGLPINDDVVADVDGILDIVYLLTDGMLKKFTGQIRSKVQFLVPEETFMSGKGCDVATFFV